MREPSVAACVSLELEDGQLAYGDGVTVAATGMQRLRDVFRTKNALTLPISGTGPVLASTTGSPASASGAGRPTRGSGGGL